MQRDELAGINTAGQQLLARWRRLCIGERGVKLPAREYADVSDAAGARDALAWRIHTSAINTFMRGSALASASGALRALVRREAGVSFLGSARAKTPGHPACASCVRSGLRGSLFSTVRKWCFSAAS